LNNLEKHIISIGYENKDCINGKEWLIEDTLKEIKTQLNKLILAKPIQATLTLVYTANINGSQNDYDIKR